jgi:hypothetical protein
MYCLVYSQIDVDRRFRGECCVHHQSDDRPDDGGSTTSEKSVDIYLTTRQYIVEDSELRWAVSFSFPRQLVPKRK